MTKDEKELLLKDLCTRLNNKIKINTPKGINILTSIEICLNDIVICSCPYGHFLIEEIKPYLRPMSSMTEKEREIFYERWMPDGYNVDTFDWLNTHHFDYRGLIEKGLAIEAPEGMYKIE